MGGVKGGYVGDLRFFTSILVYVVWREGVIGKETAIFWYLLLAFNIYLYEGRFRFFNSSGCRVLYRPWSNSFLILLPPGRNRRDGYHFCCSAPSPSRGVVEPAGLLFLGDVILGVR